MENRKVIREFLIESNENLEQLDTETPSSREASEAAPQRDLNVADSTIRVDVGLLDSLMNLVGELVLARNQVLQFNSQQEHATLNATSQRLNLITTELQEGVMKTRMQPIGMVWNKLPRLVRDLSVTFSKQIALELEGAETELDKTIIEAIKDPLTHIVRNCCDHGIERPDVRAARGKPAQGKLTLRAYHEGGQVNIEISDDGGGIDAQRVKEKAVQKGMLRPEQANRMSERELLNLVFQPGFSTAAAVTAVSGRGVGMDVVRTNIEKIGGAVDLSSKPGEGTTVKLKIPLTLAIIPGLVITSGGERFIIPQVSLLELIRLEGEAGRKQIQWIRNTPVYRRRGSLLPVAHLNRVLELGGDNGSDVINIVVLQAEDRQFGLVVDGISDTQEIVVKPLGKQLKGLSCYAGATIMGDGRVALILDALGIGQLSGVLADSQGASRAEAEQKAAVRSASQTFLLFRAGTFERLAVPLSLVARLEEFPQARVEHAGGSSVVQYRDSILSLLPLSEILAPGSEDTANSRDPVQVIVFSNGSRSVGLMVDQILDIVEDEVTARRPTARAGLLGSAVIGKKVTDLLDLGAVLSSAGQKWFDEEQKESGDAPTILLAEPSAFFAGMLRSRLEMAGYRVHQADSREELFDEFGRGGLVALLVDDNFAPAGSPALLKEIHNYPEARNLPVLVLDGMNGPIDGHDGQPAAATVKRDPAAVLAALEELTSKVSKTVAL